MEEVFEKGKRAALLTGVGTILFAGLKAVAGFVSGSVVLIADALHGASDAVTTFLAWLGLKIAKREPTEKFPYGFYKAENIGGVVISIFIFLAGFQVLKTGWNRLFSPRELSFSLLVVLVPVLDGAVMFFLGRRELEVGRRINSQSLIADGREAKSHIFLSLVVLSGLAFSFLKIPIAEPMAAFFISFFIFREGFNSLKNSVFSLLDVSPDGETEQKVRWVLEEIPGLGSFEKLKLRRSGPFLFGQVVGRVAGSVDIKRGREVSESVERKVKKEVPRIDSFTVSLEPLRKGERRVALPVDGKEGLSSEISSFFGRAPFFLFADLESGEAKETYHRPNPAREKEVRAGLGTAEFLAGQGVEVLITPEIGPIALHALRDNLVEVYQARSGKARENISQLGEDKLEPIKAPTKEKL